jgi:hypothetical protein
MSDSTNNASLGMPAVATTASGSGATPFIAMPTTPSSSASRGRGRGRYPSRTQPNNPYMSRMQSSNPYVPRRRPQVPRLPVTFGPGGLRLPNSDAELSAQRKAMAEFTRESARYDEAIEAQNRSQSRKRPHRDLSSGNGNYENSDYHAQHRERARSQGATQLPSSNEVQQTTQNAVTTTMQNLVPQTLPTLGEFNSLNHPAQLDQIRALDQEQRARGTSVARRETIGEFLSKIEVTDQVEGPPEPKKIILSKNGKPAFEVLIMHSSKTKQLALTKDDFKLIMDAATKFIRTLKGDVGPEWNWTSWSNYRGRIEVASESQAKMVSALFNGLAVTGVPQFRLWRASEIVILTQVKLKLDNGHLYDVEADEIIQGLFTKHGWVGTYSEVTNNTDELTRHVVFFMADPELRACLEGHQSGSRTFFLNLWGQDREIHMARSRLVVEAEEAAAMRLRVETALAKSIAAAKRLALIPVEPSAATLVEPPQQAQQQQDPEAHPMTEFMRLVQEAQEEHRQQQQQQQQLQQQQQEVPETAYRPEALGPSPQAGTVDRLLAEQQLLQVEQFERQQQQELLDFRLHQQQQQQQQQQHQQRQQQQQQQQQYQEQLLRQQQQPQPTQHQLGVVQHQPAQQQGAGGSAPRQSQPEAQSVLGTWELKQRQLNWELKQQGNKFADNLKNSNLTSSNLGRASVAEDTPEVVPEVSTTPESGVVRALGQAAEMRQQEHREGNKTAGNSSNLNPNQDTSYNPGFKAGYKAWLANKHPAGNQSVTQSVDSRVQRLNTPGQDEGALSGGAPRGPSEVWADEPVATRLLEASPTKQPNHDISTSGSDSSEASAARANITTGSEKVDDVGINLDEVEMSEDEVESLLEPEEEDDNTMIVGDEDS